MQASSRARRWIAGAVALQVVGLAVLVWLASVTRLVGDPLNRCFASIPAEVGEAAVTHYWSWSPPGTYCVTQTAAGVPVVYGEPSWAEVGPALIAAVLVSAALIVATWAAVKAVRSAPGRSRSAVTASMLFAGPALFAAFAFVLAFSASGSPAELPLDPEVPALQLPRPDAPPG